MPDGVVGPRGRITTIANATYTLRDADNGNTLVFTSASDVTVTVPLSLQIGWTADLVQASTGAIALSAQSGVTLQNVSGQAGTDVQWSRVKLTAYIQNNFVLSGDVVGVSLPAVRTVSGATDTILATDLGNAVSYTSGSAVAVTVPPDLPIGFTCLLIQAGAGTVTVGGGVGVTIDNRQSQFDTAGQWAECSLFSDDTDHFVLAGDTA